MKGTNTMNIEKAKNIAEHLINEYEDTPLCELPDYEFGRVIKFLTALGYHDAAHSSVLSFGWYLPVSEFVECILPVDSDQE
jgi:hypothetical protein